MHVPTIGCLYFMCLLATGLSCSFFFFFFLKSQTKFSQFNLVKHILVDKTTQVAYWESFNRSLCSSGCMIAYIILYLRIMCMYVCTYCMCACMPVCLCACFSFSFDFFSLYIFVYETNLSHMHPMLLL